MARTRRFTVRLDDRELTALNRFADHQNVLPSGALRMLIQLCPTLTQARRADRDGQNMSSDRRL